MPTEYKNIIANVVDNDDGNKLCHQSHVIFKSNNKNICKQRRTQIVQVTQENVSNFATFFMFLLIMLERNVHVHNDFFTSFQRTALYQAVMYLMEFAQTE